MEKTLLKKQPLSPTSSGGSPKSWAAMEKKEMQNKKERLAAVLAIPEMGERLVRAAEQFEKEILAKSQKE